MTLIEGTCLQQAEVCRSFLVAGVDREQNHDANVHANATCTSKDTSDNLGVHVRSGAAKGRRSQECDNRSDVHPLDVKHPIDLAKRHDDGHAPNHEAALKLVSIRGVAGNVVPN